MHLPTSNQRATLTFASCVTALACLFLLGASPRAVSGATLGSLRSQLSAEQAHASGLSSNVARLSGMIGVLRSQIALVQGREATVRSTLASDRLRLAATRRKLSLERGWLVRLRSVLARARGLLARQLVSGYERPRMDLVSVVLSARGFTDLLENLDFLHRVVHQQQLLIDLTRAAKARADAVARSLSGLASVQVRDTQAAGLQARALAGMDSLLSAKQGTLAQLQGAQQAALVSTQARTGALRSQISREQARQAAAAASAASAASSSATSSSASSSPGAGGPGVGPALGPSGGWAIPYAIVMCESGGQNLPPNGAGASGYYQILPGTWSLYGGSGPAAYLASKSEQDSVASRIWAGGSGASQWVCAGIVGIH